MMVSFTFAGLKSMRTVVYAALSCLVAILVFPGPMDRVLGEEMESPFSLSKYGDSRPSSTDHLFSLTKGDVSKLMEKALEDEQFERVKAIYETLGSKGSVGSQSVSAPDLSLIYSKALTKLGKYGMAERQLDQLKSRELGLEMRADVWKTFGDLMSEKGDYAKAWESYETAENIYLTKNFGLKSPDDLRDLYARMEKAFSNSPDRGAYMERLLLKKGTSFKGELYGNISLVELADRVLNEGFTSDRYSRAREILVPVTSVPVAWKEGDGQPGTEEGDYLRRLKLRFLQIKARSIAADSYFKEGLFPEAVREGKFLPEEIGVFVREGLSGQNRGEEIAAMESESTAMKARLEKNLEWIMRRELVISASSSIAADGVLNLSIQARNIPSVTLRVASIDFVELVERTRTFAWSDKEESLAAMFGAARRDPGGVKDVTVVIEGHENHRLTGKIEDLTSLVDWASQAVLIVAEAGGITKYQVVLISSVAVLVHQDHDRAAVFWCDMAGQKNGPSIRDKSGPDGIDLLFAYGHSYDRGEGRYVYKHIRKISPTAPAGKGSASSGTVDPLGKYGNFVLEFPPETDHNNLVVMVRTPRGIGLSAISYVPKVPRIGELRTSVLCLRDEYTAGIDTSASAVFVTRKILPAGCQGADAGRTEVTVRDEGGVKKIDFKGISGPGIRDYGTFSHASINLDKEVFTPGIYRGEIRAGFETRADFSFLVSPEPGDDVKAQFDGPASIPPGEQFSGKVILRNRSGIRVSGREFAYRIISGTGKDTSAAGKGRVRVTGNSGAGKALSGLLTTDGAGEANLAIPAGTIPKTWDFFNLRIENPTNGSLLCATRVDLARSRGMVDINPLTRFFGPGAKGSEDHCRIGVRVSGPQGEPVPANLTILVSPHARLSQTEVQTSTAIDFRASGGTCEAVIKAREFRHGSGPYLLTVEAESGGKNRISETTTVWFLDRALDGESSADVSRDLGLKGVKVIPLRSSALPGESIPAAVVSSFGDKPVFFLVCGKGIYDWGTVLPGPDGIGFFNFKVSEDTSGAVWVKALSVSNRSLAVDEAPISLEAVSSVSGIKISMPELGLGENAAQDALAYPVKRSPDQSRDCLRPGDRVDFIFQIHGCDGKQIIGLRDSGGKIFSTPGSSTIPVGSEIFVVYRLFRTPSDVIDEARISGRRTGMVKVLPSTGFISSFLGEAGPSVSESIPDCLGRVSDPYPKTLDIQPPGGACSASGGAYPFGVPWFRAPGTQSGVAGLSASGQRGRGSLPMVSGPYSSWPLAREVVRPLLQAKASPGKEIFRIPVDFEGLLRVEAYYVSPDRIGEAAIEVPVRPALSVRLDCPDWIYSGDWTRIKTTVATDFQDFIKGANSGKTAMFIRSSVEGAAVGLSAPSGGETVEVGQWDSVNLGIPVKAMWPGVAGIDALVRAGAARVAAKRKIDVLEPGFPIPWGEELIFQGGTCFFGGSAPSGGAGTAAPGLHVQQDRLETDRWTGEKAIIVGRDLWDCGTAVLATMKGDGEVNDSAISAMGLGMVLRRVLRKPGAKALNPAVAPDLFAHAAGLARSVSAAYAPATGQTAPFLASPDPFAIFGIAPVRPSDGQGRTRNPDTAELYRAAAIRRMAKAWDFLDSLPRVSQTKAVTETCEEIARALKIADAVIEAGIKSLDLTIDPDLAAVLVHAMAKGAQIRVEFATKLAKIFGAIPESFDLGGSARLALACLEEGLDSEAASILSTIAVGLSTLDLSVPRCIGGGGDSGENKGGTARAASLALAVRAVSLAGRTRGDEPLSEDFIVKYLKVLGGSFGSDGWSGPAGTAETLSTLAALHDRGIVSSRALENLESRGGPADVPPLHLEIAFTGIDSGSLSGLGASKSALSGSMGITVGSGKTYRVNWPEKPDAAGWPEQIWPGGPVRLGLGVEGDTGGVSKGTVKWSGWPGPRAIMTRGAIWKAAEEASGVAQDREPAVLSLSKAVLIPEETLHEGIFRGAVARMGLTLSVKKGSGRLILRDRLPGGATPAICRGQEVTFAARGADGHETSGPSTVWIFKNGDGFVFHVTVPSQFSGEISIEYPVRFDHAGEFLVPSAAVWCGGGFPSATSGESRIRVTE